MKQVSIFVLVLLIGAVVLGVAGNGPAAQRSSVPRVASQPADYSPAYLAARNQPHWCGTNEVWEMRKAEQQLIAPEAMACATQGPCDVPATRDAIATDPILIRVLFHSMHMDDGSGGASQAQVDATFAQMQADFAPYNIYFENMGTRHHNDTANYCIAAYGVGSWWLDIDQMKSLYAESPATQCNVFISCQDSGPYGSILGIATFPWDGQALTSLGGLWLNKDAVGAGTKTLTHEMGHCLGLWHTHHGVDEVTSCGACYEYASGVEGDVRGDFADDTPPTPTNYTCSPPGGVDCQGTPWGATQPENYMGYGPDWCYSLFTAKQMRRMFCWIDDELTGWRTYPCAALADFTADATHGCAPFTVNFTDLSSGPVLGWLWDFGDGNTSILQNPTHVYTTSDTFTVSLTVSADTCTNTMTRYDYITVPSGVICDIEPASLDFGSVELDDSLDASFTIKNMGCDTLSGVVSEFCIPYSVVAGAGSYDLAPAESLVVTVRYKPTSTGTQNCWIVTGTTDCADVFCTGTGVEPPPACLIEPDTLDYGTLDVGTFATLSFTITNTGYGILQGTVSESCEMFSLLSTPDYLLTHNQSHQIDVIFVASSEGLHECTIETGSALCPDVYAFGYGGSPPVCEVEPDSLDFGTITVNDSLDLDFYITNTGGGVLAGSVVDTCGYFEVVSGGGPYSLASGDTAYVTMRFKPLADGSFECTVETGDAACVDVFCRGVGELEGVGILAQEPGKLTLYQNFPNPFNPSTTIAFWLPQSENVNLRIYDVNGALIRTLADEVLDEGINRYPWDGRDSKGNVVSSGVYFYRLRTGASVLTKKMVLLK